MGRLRPDMNYFTQFQKNLGKNKGYVGILIQMVTVIAATLLIFMAFVLPLLDLFDTSQFDGPLTDQMIMSVLENTTFDSFGTSLLVAVIVLLLSFFICVGTQHLTVLAAKGELKGQSYMKVIAQGAKRYSLRFVGLFLMYMVLIVIASVLLGAASFLTTVDLESFNVSALFLTFLMAYLLLLPMPFVYALTFEEGPKEVVSQFIRRHPVLFWGLPMLLSVVSLFPLVSLVFNVLSLFLPLYYMTIFVEDMKDSTEKMSDELETEE